MLIRPAIATIVSNLPSGISQGLAIGAADVKFSNGVLYGLLAGGRDNGSRDVPSSTGRSPAMRAAITTM